MKSLTILTSVSLLALCACSGQKQKQEAQEPQPIPAQVLIAQLQGLQSQNKIAFGHHDDPAYGVNWEYMPDSSDIKNITGDYPAIFDWDLGQIEWEMPTQLDSVPFSFIKEQAVAHAAKGGINSFSWHLRNPVSKGTSWDIEAGNVVAACLNDSIINDTIRVWIGRAADFLGELRDSTGTRIPVIFRPWHECTGSWFWWGEKLCSPDEYKDLWKLTREIFDEKGIDNVVWAYGPGSEARTVEDYMVRYPGDDLIDIVGFDTYVYGEDMQPYLDNMKRGLDIVTQMAKEHGKIPALTETGYESVKKTDYFTQVLYPTIKDYPIAYVTLWRNSNKIPNHYYVPYPGHPAAPDFLEFYNLPQTAFLSDLEKGE